MENYAEKLKNSSLEHIQELEERRAELLGDIPRINEEIKVKKNEKWYWNNPWKDVIVGEEKFLKGTRWYLKPKGVQALKEYKESLEKANLPVPTVLKGI